MDSNYKVLKAFSTGPDEAKVNYEIDAEVSSATLVEAGADVAALVADGTLEAITPEKEAVAPAAADTVAATPTPVELYKDRVFEIRASMQGIEEAVLALKKDIPEDALVNAGEVAANVMLAYRHAEDLRMRLGKICQACNGGQSVFPK